MLQLLGNIRQARVSAKLSQAEMADILGVSQQVYSNIEAGKVKKVSAEVAKKYQDWAVTNNLVEEPTLTYQKSRLQSKLNGSREDVPVYNGSTTLGNITLFSDENKEQIAALAGIDKKLTCHVSRHTFANQMFQEFGMEGIGLISRTLGHTTEATTRNYVLPLANEGISKKVSEFYGKIKR